MFTTNDDWSTGPEQDVLNQSLFGNETNAVKLLSFTKLLNSCQTNKNNTTNDKSNINKRKLQLTQTDEGGKKKRKKKKKDVLIPDADKKVLLSVRVKKKKKKENTVAGCAEPAPDQDSSGINAQTVTADQLQNKKKRKIKDNNDVESLDERTENTIEIKTKKRKKKKRKAMDVTADCGSEKVSQVTNATNSNDEADRNICNAVSDSRDFNELYSESDDASVPPPSKKNKRKKDKGMEGDVLVISDSTLNITKPNHNETKQHPKTTEDEQVSKPAQKKKKVKKKGELDLGTQCSLVNGHNNKTIDNEEPQLGIQMKPRKKTKKTKGLEIKTTAKCDTLPAEIASPEPQLDLLRKGCLAGSTSKYSKFQKRLMEKLKGGQFRWINERLYSCKSDEAENMFSTDPNLFQVYHTGFHAQVQQWPQNPVDVMVEYVKQRGEDIVVADFGCGDAKLASSVPNKVHSFDLVAVNERVTACDMKKVPLAGKSVDVAVFCLSLMGTNLVDFLMEAHRILKPGGVLKIAEVKSRFVDVDKFNADVSSLGFSMLHQDDSNKMFILLDFQKTSGDGQSSRRATDITLNPCIYKRM